MGAFGASDRDPTIRNGGGFSWAAGALRRGVGLREEERKRGPAVVSETETSDDGTGNGTAMSLTVGLSNELRM